MTKYLTLAAALAVSTAALADDTKTTNPGMDTTATTPAATFQALDKNADGKLSRMEAEGNARVSASLATADANGDGALTKAEFDAYFSKPKS